MVTEILRAIASQAWPLVMSALAALVATSTKELWLRGLGFIAAVAFGFLFLLLAVLDSRTIYRSHTAARKLADLRREGWKRYTEWWTICQNEVTAREVESEAEAIRLRIIELLNSNVSEPAGAPSELLPRLYQ